MTLRGLVGRVIKLSGSLGELQGYNRGTIANVKADLLSATQEILRFGVFELNLDTEELRKSGVVLKLAPQPFRLLAVLASHAGQVVTREAIQRQLWGELTEVDAEHGMRQCINQIRTSLGDDSDNPVYVETIPRQGYRFLPPVMSQTVAAPRPQVSESSDSGMVNDIASQVLARVAALSARGVVEAQTEATTTAAPVSETASNRKPGWRLTPVKLALGFVVLVALLAVGRYWRPRKVSALTEKDTIVLADFDNSAGDPVFDDTLKQGLAIQLEQSPFLNVLSDRKVAGTLKLMNHSAGEPLTAEVAREVCLRTNSKAMLTGSIALLGRQYVIGVKAVDCNTGDVLAEAQEQATGKEGLLKALDAAAASLRGKLGESLSSVQKYATPLEEASTPSLEALKAYSLGRKAKIAKGQTQSLPFFKRAVELDPNFAMAYVGMAGAYINLNQPDRAGENARKAYELREKLSERERLYIETTYYVATTGELEKAAEVSELWQQTYPRDEVPYHNLGFIFSSLGNWEGALEEAREANRLEPIDLGNIGQAYMALNRLDEAEAVYQHAAERKVENESFLVARYLLAFLKNDTVQMERLVASTTGKPGVEDLLLASEADTQAWYGKLRSARELTRRAMDSAERNDARETAAGYKAEAALREVEAGNREQARADAHAAVALAPNRDVRAMAALALARAGDTGAAEKLAADLDVKYPLDTLVQAYWLPAIGAAVALQKKDPNRAVELLKQAGAIELGQATQLNVYLCPVYLRGEAYLMLDDGNAATTEFHKFIDHSGLVGNFPWGALARLGLARAYVSQGDMEKARVAYQDFFTLWKGADPDVPVLKQAKGEYSMLQ